MDTMKLTRRQNESKQGDTMKVNKGDTMKVDKGLELKSSRLHFTD